jgi:hypothetical protein
MADSLLDPFWQPEIDPAQPAELPDDVVSFRAASNLHAGVELLRRSTGTFGFRYRAWVAWRDAGGAARRHSRHESNPTRASSPMTWRQHVRAPSTTRRHTASGSMGRGNVPPNMRIIGTFWRCTPLQARPAQAMRGAFGIRYLRHGKGRAAEWMSASRVLRFPSRRLYLRYEDRHLHPR